MWEGAGGQYVNIFLIDGPIWTNEVSSDSCWSEERAGGGGADVGGGHFDTMTISSLFMVRFGQMRFHRIAVGLEKEQGAAGWMREGAIFDTMIPHTSCLIPHTSLTPHTSFVHIGS